MNRPDFLSQLPSLEELLEHPRVSSAIDRVNQSSAAVQVRNAVTSLGAEISRRAESLQSLGAGELLDRLVRQLEVPRATPSTRSINASGRFFGAPLTRPPLAASAIDAARLAADGFRANSVSLAAPTAARLLACEAAHVFSSAHRALATSLEALAADGGACVVARGDMTELARGVRLDQVCRRYGVALREVGAADAATADDYREALSQLAADGVTRVVVLARGSVAQAGSTRLRELSEVAGQGGATLVVDRGRARPRRDTPAYEDTSASVEESLAEGADAVLLDSAGLIGGPTAGLVVGNAATLDKIAGSTGAKADAIDPMIDAALAATLALFERPSELRFSHPLHQLLDAPVENLRQRAERIASLIGAASEGASAVERPCELRPSTWGVLVASTSEAEAARRRLAAGDPAVIAGGAQDEVFLDLSTVFPSQDTALAAAFGPRPDPTTPEAENTDSERS